jgi:hypothetical protein
MLMVRDCCDSVWRLRIAESGWTVDSFDRNG